MSDSNPQGITLHFMATGNPRRDLLALGAAGTHPRIDPACLPSPTYLALPIRTAAQQITGFRVREFDPEMAADRLSREPYVAQASGIRLATDEEVAAYKQEAAARGEQMRADRERLAAAELQRHLAETQYKAETQAAIRTVLSTPKGG